MDREKRVRWEYLELYAGKSLTRQLETPEKHGPYDKLTGSERNILLMITIYRDSSCDRQVLTDEEMPDGLLYTFDETVARLGQEGWEMVSASGFPLALRARRDEPERHEEVVFWFKRPL